MDKFEEKANYVLQKILAVQSAVTGTIAYQEDCIKDVVEALRQADKEARLDCARIAEREFADDIGGWDGASEDIGKAIRESIKEVGKDNN